jgi:hypothetical protein
LVRISNLFLFCDLKETSPGVSIVDSFQEQRQALGGDYEVPDVSKHLPSGPEF